VRFWFPDTFPETVELCGDFGYAFVMRTRVPRSWPVDLKVIAVMLAGYLAYCVARWLGWW